MEEYGYAQSGAVDVKPLDTICNIADEAERTATLISAFIARFRHGDIPEQANAARQLQPVRSGHVGQLDRLREAVADANKLARELGTLG